MPGEHGSAGGAERSALRGDCANCFGLCCVALPFAASAGFAVDKEAGRPCHNLRPDFGCGIHARLRDEGFPGCTVYDCFGAGQKVAQATYGGRDWRRAPSTAREMFDVFPVMRQLQELLVYLDDALGRERTRPLHPRLRAAYDTVDRLTRARPAELLALDVPAQRGEVNALLLRASELVRSGAGGARTPGSRRASVKDRRGADLIGARLAGTDLSGADLRGAYLIAADLRGADLTRADFIGADLRDADLSGADLTGCIFLTQPQVESAKGDARTVLPPARTRPAHWAG
ncbi:pentapeptide repeat-containing protein [Nocardiopsis sediminis]|uniref:Pentapeptide repeat-containing protein n=1 Tax=Nocardiopsis sediminis TaxID=1778267 RepID=A0ABV8FUL7_9ACTN